MRLVPHPTSPQEGVGRLEVFHDRRWGRICDDRWDDPTNLAPEMACRFPNKGYETGEVLLGRGMPQAPASRPIWLDDVRCVSELASHWPGSPSPPTELSHCFRAGWGLNNCTHEEDIVLHCGDAADFSNQRSRPIRGHATLNCKGDTDLLANKTSVAAAARRRAARSPASGSPSKAAAPTEEWPGSALIRCRAGPRSISVGAPMRIPASTCAAVPGWSCWRRWASRRFRCVRPGEGTATTSGVPRRCASGLALGWRWCGYR